jgi:hypothetical protein
MLLKWGSVWGFMPAKDLKFIGIARANSGGVQTPELSVFVLDNDISGGFVGDDDDDDDDGPTNEVWI